MRTEWKRKQLLLWMDLKNEKGAKKNGGDGEEGI